MQEAFERSQLLIDVNKLKTKTVAIFGLGGVGGYVVEGLVRSGVSSFLLIDFDTISLTNLNRQILATHSTIHKKKVEVQKNRILDIQPAAKVITYDLKVDKTTINQIDFQNVDFIVDAIDMVTSKILLIETAKKNNIPIISCMGTGNKLNPFLFEICDISKTSICPLARVMRYELKKRNIKNVPVLYSKEENVTKDIITNEEERRHIPGSVSFVPSVAGLLLSSYVIKELLK